MQILISIVFIFQVEWKLKHKINHNEFQVDPQDNTLKWSVFLLLAKNGEKVHFIFSQ